MEPIIERFPGVPPIEFDWIAYYQHFKESHGGNPVLYEGSLLFPDGWRYSSQRFIGPETPPPSKTEEHRLKKEYLRIRIAQNSREQREVELQLHSFRVLQDGRSVPLFTSQEGLDDEGNPQQYSVEIDPIIFTGRIEWLRSDVEACQQKLKELQNEPIA